MTKATVVVNKENSQGSRVLDAHSKQCISDQCDNE